MKQIALVTYLELPELSASDRLLLQPLIDLGVQPVAVSWDDPLVDWTQFDAVVLRSCWNYHKRFSDFKQWIHHLQAQNVHLYNTPQTVLWNMEKTYLRELNKMGIRTIPTVWIESGEAPNLADVLQAQGWQHAVIKPTVGASADGIQVVSLESAAEHQVSLQAQLQTSGIMVQSVIAEIKNGELSLVFINHTLSHTIRKLPGSGTIFVNSAYGGEYHQVDVPQHVHDTAITILNAALERTGQTSYLYARVDGVMIDDAFVLMELELIEPSLFLERVDDASIMRFARAIAGKANLSS